MISTATPGSGHCRRTAHARSAHGSGRAGWFAGTCPVAGMPCRGFGDGKCDGVRRCAPEHEGWIVDASDQNPATTAPGYPSAARTLPDVFQRRWRCTDVAAIRTLGRGIELTWTEFGVRARGLSGGLALLGCRRGGRGAILTRRFPRHSSAGGLESHGVAELFELMDRAAFGPDVLDPGVVVGAEVVIERSGVGHVPDRYEDGVLDRDEGLALASSGREAPVAPRWLFLLRAAFIAAVPSTALR